MPKKQYNRNNATGERLDYEGLVSGLPAEMQPQMEEATVMAINAIHGDGQQPGVAEGILEKISADEEPGNAIASATMSIVDMVNQQAPLDEGVKLLLGFVITKELVELSNEVLDTGISDEEATEIFETALTVFLHEQIVSKPTREGRDAEAVRIQKEVDPLVPPELRDKGNETAGKMGIQTGNVQESEDPYAKAEARA